MLRYISRIITVISVLAISSITFSGISAKSQSLKHLRQKANYHCKQARSFEYQVSASKSSYTHAKDQWGWCSTEKLRRQKICKDWLRKAISAEKRYKRAVRNARSHRRACNKYLRLADNRVKNQIRANNRRRARDRARQNRHSKSASQLVASQFLMGVIEGGAIIRRHRHRRYDSAHRRPNTRRSHNQRIRDAKRRRQRTPHSNTTRRHKRAFSENVWLNPKNRRSRKRAR